MLKGNIELKYGHNLTIVTFSAKSSKLCGNFSKITLTFSISKKHNVTTVTMKKHMNICINMVPFPTTPLLTQLPILKFKNYLNPLPFW